MNFSKHTLAYLATPFTKYALGHTRAIVDATRIAADLYASGIIVYSPIAYCAALAASSGLPMEDYRFWLPIEDRMCGACDALIVAQLDGWQESEGIAREVARFERWGKSIYDLDPTSMRMARRQKECALVALERMP